MCVYVCLNIHTHTYVFFIINFSPSSTYNGETKCKDGKSGGVKGSFVRRESRLRGYRPFKWNLRVDLCPN